jgi:4-amino-4-deoxy-L-arabinose transferase-like glycosyltransferase
LSLVRLLVERLALRGGWLAGAVLAIAAFNLAFRIGNELVQVWDESLFAITAGEMVDSGDWIGTTFLGALDYYNSKPPLQMWLVALSFKAFEPGLVSLRLPSILAAWCTVGLLMWWAGRVFGRATGILAALVLATTYGFLYVHSGRSGNSDALFTLLNLLTVVTLWASRDHPWRRVWLGAIVGAVFLVKGMGILMPAIIIGGVELGALWRGDLNRRTRWMPLLAAAGVFVLVVAPWAIARWQVDGWRFFDAMFFHDFVDRASTVLEGHEGEAWYYLYFLQKHHYDWLLALVVALACLPERWSRVRTLMTAPDRFTAPLLLSWFAATFVLPSVVATKLGWYLNSFYPLFALVVARVVIAAWQATPAHPLRTALVAASFAMALGVAEGKLAWHSYQLLDVKRSAQSLFLSQGPAIAGQHVYATTWPHADRFVVRTVGGRCLRAESVDAFLAASHADDLWLGPPDADARLVPLATTGRQTLYRRRP